MELLAEEGAANIRRLCCDVIEIGAFHGCGLLGRIY